MTKKVSKYKLPSGWALAVIDDLIGPEGLFMDGDWIESKDQNTNGEVRLIQLADIGDGYFRNRSNRYMTLDSANELNCTFLEPDDILVARMPDPLGRCTIFPIKDGEKYVTVVDVAIIRPGEKGVYGKYLMYFINSPVLRKTIELLQTGTTRKRISRGNLGKLKIPVPPLNEQYRIVSKIEELLSELEHAEHNLKKSQKQLEIYKQSILKSAFEGSLTLKKNKANTTSVDVLIKQIAEERQAQYEKLNSIWLDEIKKWEKKGKKNKRPSKPEKPVYPSELTSKELASLPKLSPQWKWIKIGYVDELTSAGSTPKGGKNIYSKSGIAFIRSQNVYPGKLLTDDLVYISKEIHGQMNRTHIKERDVLLNITGASIGRSAFVPDNFGEGNVNQHVCIIRIPLSYISEKYLSYYLNSPNAQILIDSINSGATREALTLDHIRNFPFPICSLEEQNLVIQELEYRFTIIDNLEKTIAKNLQKVQVFRFGILKKAYEGNLVEQQIDDEPADVFLGRLKEERDAYLLEQKAISKLNPKIKTIKIMEEIEIIDVLKAAKKPMTAKEVWKASKYRDDIESFYAQLKKIKNKIVETKKGSESLLSLKK